MKDAVWLAWIEQLAVAPAGDDRENELPRSLFYCRLDDQPDHLVPQRLLRPEYWEGLTDRPLFLSSDCFFTPGGELPAGTPVAVFAHQGQMVWIRDPGSDALQPFWLGPELATILSGVQPGDPAPALSPQARRTLMLANLLTPDDYSFCRRQDWADIVSVTGAKFQSQGYAPVGRLIHPFHIAALRRYYRHQLRTGKLRLGDSQSPLRYVSYNDPVIRFFHQHLTKAISAFAGEALKPSYVYLASYQPGAELEKHTDREQCEFSVTLCLDYSPEPQNATPWPLLLHEESGKVTVFQAIGDALLYRGCEIPHSREALPEGHTSTSIFFHYVREDFAGSLD
ncbi:MAG: hypothetical protein WB711_16955 [Terriglobales bacterium]